MWYNWYKDYDVSVIVIDEGITDIGECAFPVNSRISSIYIPASVTRIGHYAFWSGNKNVHLKDVYYGGTAAQWSAIDIGQENDALLDAKIHYYSEDTILGTFAHFTNGRHPTGPVWAFADGTLTISGQGDGYLTGAMHTSPRVEGNLYTNFSDEIDTIRIEADVNASNLGELISDATPRIIEVASGNRTFSIRNGALYSNGGKTLVRYPAGKSSTSFTIPDGVSAIGTFAFYKSSNLTSVTIPVSVTSIGDYAFGGCSSLKNVYYGGSEEQWSKVRPWGFPEWIEDIMHFAVTSTARAA